MYKAFFNLTRNPFDLTPDPTFLFPTIRHNEALAALYHGVRQHKGFVVVTGEVGTGKTLLLRCLLRQLKQSNDVAYAYLFNGRLTPIEFLEYILSDFGLPVAGKNKAALLLSLSQFVVSRGSAGLTTALILDEAHHLSAEILEEVRLLTNLETFEDKLLQIVLVGQPELEEKLDSADLRQLKQRIALRAHLDPLDEDETKRYVERRLQIAGAGSQAASIFSEQAIAAVYRHSRGFPRLINTICENALIAAYARQSPQIAADIIDDVAKEFRLDVTYGSREFNGNHGNGDGEHFSQRGSDAGEASAARRELGIPNGRAGRDGAAGNSLTSLRSMSIDQLLEICSRSRGQA